MHEFHCVKLPEKLAGAHSVASAYQAVVGKGYPFFVP